MAIKLYDDAIVEFIKSWSDKKLKIMKPNEVAEFFQMTDDQREDKILTLPLLMLSREPNITILGNKMQPRSYNGDRMYGNSADDKTALLNSVDISVSYQLDIFTKNFDECDEYVRDLIFKFLNHPKLTIVVPYNNINYTHTFTMWLDQEVEDNTDIPQRLFKGQFTRFTLKINVDDAKIWSVPVKNNYKIKEIIYEQVENNSEPLIISEEKIDM